MKKLMVMAVLLLFFTGSAHAAEWNFYGSARVNTTVTQFDNDPFNSGAAILGLTPSVLDSLLPPGFPPSMFTVLKDTDDYEQNLYGNARIGAKVKVSDELTGHFEYGALGGSANVRILWGEWNFGAGSLGVGQNYTPLLFPYSNQTYSIDGFNKGDHNMSTFGMLYGGRKAMVRLKFGNFQIAAVEPKTLISLSPALTGASTVGFYPFPVDVETTLPSIQAKYKYDFDAGHVAVAAGYQTFELNTGTTSHDVDSYIIGIGGRFNVGAAYFKGNFWGGQNVGNMADILVNGAIYSNAANAGSSTLDGDGFGFAQWDGTQVNDRDAYAYLIVAGYEIRKGLYLEAGYGYVNTELDIPGAEDDDAQTYYIQSTIFLAPGVFLTPEIGRVDMKHAEQPEATYYGIKWQINF